MPRGDAMNAASVPADAFTTSRDPGLTHGAASRGEVPPPAVHPTSQPAEGGWLDGRFEENLILTTLESALNWGSANAIWPMTFGIACCAMEMMAIGGPRVDLERFGCGAFRATPRQADLMIVAGTVTHKMASRLRRLYEQMPDPKYVIAMGACTVGGGPYFKHGYHVVKGVDLVVPVDVYVPAARRGPRRCWKASSGCRTRSRPASSAAADGAGSTTATLSRTTPAAWRCPWWPATAASPCGRWPPDGRPLTFTSISPPGASPARRIKHPMSDPGPPTDRPPAPRSSKSATCTSPWGRRRSSAAWTSRSAAGRSTP